MTNRSAAVAAKSAEFHPVKDSWWQKAGRWLIIAASMKNHLRSLAAVLGCLLLTSCFSMRAMEKNASSDPDVTPPTGGLGGAALLDLVTLPVQLPWLAYRAVTKQ
jgi:hypothetical protein